MNSGNQVFTQTNQNLVFFNQMEKLMFGGNHISIWRKPTEEMHAKHLKSTVKHGDGSVIVWDCMSAAGTGQLDYLLCPLWITSNIWTF